MSRRAIVMPDLDLGGVSMKLIGWRVAEGGEVFEGDRLAEVLAGETLLDISAECDGQLVRRCIGEERDVRAGDVLGYLQPADEGRVP